MTQQPAESQPSRMVTVVEVCEQLGIGKTKFYDLVNKGELAVIDINGVGKRLPGEIGRRRSIRVEQTAVDAFKARNRVSA